MGPAFLVPALLTAASTGANYYNQSQATSKANDSEIAAIQQQQGLRQKANANVSALTSQVAHDNPNSLAAQATGQYVSQLRKNAAGSTQGGSTTSGTQNFGASSSALPAAAGANSRYGTDLANGQTQVQDFGNTYANEMGQIDAATRLRQNEGLGMQTLGTNLNTLNQSSYGDNFVNQLRTQAAGQTNPWLALGANLVGGAGNAMSKNPSAYFGTPTQSLGDLAGGMGYSPQINPNYAFNTGFSQVPQ